MASKWNKGAESVTQAEHIAPDKTGDNIEAKRIANFAWDGSNWQRQGLLLAPIKDYDYLDVQQTNATTETYIFKTGGSGGTTIRTIVIVYTNSTKEDINTVSWS